MKATECSKLNMNRLMFTMLVLSHETRVDDRPAECIAEKGGQ
jgi:hypothetical protein